MIHDTDLIDVLVARLKTSHWAAQQVGDIRRVWGGDVHADQVKPGQLLVQLWPQGQTHERPQRAGRWALTVSLSIGFYFRVSSQTMQEVDAALQSFDRLLVSDEEGLGGDLLDAVVVTKSTATETESLTFVREPQITWSVRPDRERLQRIQPDGDREAYSGLCQSQAEMTYRGYY